MIKNNFFKFTLAACAMLGFVGCSKDYTQKTVYIGGVKVTE